MPRGGRRPGAGRPRKDGASAAKPAAPASPASQASPPELRLLTPLEYMLAVMNDEAADRARRDKMAVAAAPFMHVRGEAVALGKKARRDRDAKEVTKGRFSPSAPPKLVVNNK